MFGVALLLILLIVGRLVRLLVSWIGFSLQERSTSVEVDQWQQHCTTNNKSNVEEVLYQKGVVSIVIFFRFVFSRQ